jgi:hypothetical protein
MSTHLRHKIRREVELIQRFAGSYGRKFDALIARLNHTPADSADGQSLRLCVEAINMVLNMQEHLAGVLADLTGEPAPLEAGAGPRLRAA